MKRTIRTLASVLAILVLGCGSDSTAPQPLVPEQPAPPPPPPAPHASVAWDRTHSYTDEYAWGSRSPGADGYYKLTGWCKNVGTITAYRPKVLIPKPGCSSPGDSACQSWGWVYSDSAGSGTLVSVDSLVPVDSLNPYVPTAHFTITYKMYGYISPNLGYCASCQSTSDLVFTWDE